jgi:hypothetical protein
MLTCTFIFWRTSHHGYAYGNVFYIYINQSVIKYDDLYSDILFTTSVDYPHGAHIKRCLQKRHGGGTSHRAPGKKIAHKKGDARLVIHALYYELRINMACRSFFTNYYHAQIEAHTPIVQRMWHCLNSNNTPLFCKRTFLGFVPIDSNG